MQQEMSKIDHSYKKVSEAVYEKGWLVQS